MKREVSDNYLFFLHYLILPPFSYCATAGCIVWLPSTALLRNNVTSLFVFPHTRTHAWTYKFVCLCLSFAFILFELNNNDSLYWLNVDLTWATRHMLQKPDMKWQPLNHTHTTKISCRHHYLQSHKYQTAKRAPNQKCRPSYLEASNNTTILSKWHDEDDSNACKNCWKTMNITGLVRATITTTIRVNVTGTGSEMNVWCGKTRRVMMSTKFAFNAPLPA